MPKISPKLEFFDFCQKINPFMFLFYPIMVPKRVLCDSLKSTCLKKKSGPKMQYFLIIIYIWKKSSSILVIFHGVGLQEKAASEKAVVWSDVARFALHAIRLYDSLIINIVGANQVTSFGCLWPVMCSWSNWIAGFFSYQYLWKE